MSVDLAKMYQILAENGYESGRYSIDLQIYGEYNQVIIVKDTLKHRYTEYPVEDNVLEWSTDRLADAVIDAIDRANNMAK